MLHGPLNGRMQPVIYESLGRSAHVHVRLARRRFMSWEEGEVLFEGYGDHVALEVFGDTESLRATSALYPL